MMSALIGFMPAVAGQSSGRCPSWPGAPVIWFNARGGANLDVFFRSSPISLKNVIQASLGNAGLKMARMPDESILTEM